MEPKRLLKEGKGRRDVRHIDDGVAKLHDDLPVGPNTGVKRHLGRAQHGTRLGPCWVRPKCPLERLVSAQPTARRPPQAWRRLLLGHRWRQVPKLWTTWTATRRQPTWPAMRARKQATKWQAGTR